MCVLQGKNFLFDFISCNFPCLLCWKIINFPFSTISSESVQLKIRIYHHSFLNSIRFAAVLFQPKIESLQKWFCFSFTLVDQKKVCSINGSSVNGVRSLYWRQITMSRARNILWGWKKYIHHIITRSIAMRRNGTWILVYIVV